MKMHYVVFEFIRTRGWGIPYPYKKHNKIPIKYYKQEAAYYVCNAMNRVNENPNSEYRVLMGYNE